MFHVKHEVWAEWAGAVGVELTPEMASRLESFATLVRDHGTALGLVGAADLPRLRERHLLDCLRAVAAVRKADRLAYDLGSGAGLPGIVVGIACPSLEVSLIEARRTRGAFLEMAVERLHLVNVRAVISRFEAVTEPADICFARALADAAASWRAADKLLRPGGRLVYFAGSSFDAGADVPIGVRAHILDRVAPVPLARGGPLVIMSRQ
jgi:16S rRNA (guanine527-N7)-methyltransferase